MLPPGCPAWQYSAHADCARLLPAATALLLAGIQAGKYPVDTFARDTRPIHGQLFAGLSPVGYAYYVGTYRGSHQKCLRTYDVDVGGDPLAGAPASKVFAEITSLGTAIARMTVKIESALATGALIDQNLRSIAVVRLACDAFVRFLTVHPFADGNGHTARALLWLILFQFGYKPDGWTIDPRPPFRNYASLIAQHRRGDSGPLEQFVLSCISPI